MRDLFNLEFSFPSCCQRCGVVFVLSLWTSCIRNGRVFRNLFDWFKCCGQTRLAPKIVCPRVLYAILLVDTRGECGIQQTTNTHIAFHTPIFIVLRETPAWEIFVRLQLELNYIHRWLSQRRPFCTCAWTASLLHFHFPFDSLLIFYHTWNSTLFFWSLAGTPWRFTGHCRRHWQEPPDAKDNASHDERNRKGLPFILKHCSSLCNLSHTLFTFSD